MDIQQLKEHARYCYEIDDLPALFIMYYLLPHRSGNMCDELIASKRDLWLAYKDFVQRRIREWEDDQERQLRQMEITFDVSISLLEKKGILRKDKKNENFMIALDYPPEHYGENPFRDVTYYCKKRFDEISKPNDCFSINNLKKLHNELRKNETENNPEESNPSYEIVFEDKGEGQVWTPDWRDMTWNSIRDFPKFEEVKKDMKDWLDQQKLSDSLDALSDQNFEEIAKAVFNEKKEELDPTPITKHYIERRTSGREFLEDLPENDLNKLEITHLIDRLENTLRDLLDSKGFAPTKKWGMNDGGKLEEIRENLNKQREKKRKKAASQMVGNPKILTECKEILNAATLGELFAIICYAQRTSKEFDDVFSDFSGNGSKPQKMDIYFQEAIDLRNPRFHNDAQITWNNDMVTKTKAVTNEILVPIGKWFQR